ncbi:MAG: LytTR family DNA-binding domain-containing protein [Paracoccus sp. (in: a-proteobacteria)]
MLMFIIVFLVVIIASDPVLFPTLPDFRSRAIYWTVSAVIYMLLLPYWIKYYWRLWTSWTDRPIPHILATAPFAMPQAALGIWIWSLLGFDEAVGGMPGILSTVVQNTVIVHLAEMGAVLWLLPAYREAQRNPEGDSPGPSGPKSAGGQFVVLNGRSVPLGSIRLVRSAEHYLILTTDRRTIDLRARMKDFLTQLSEEDGIQTHRSYWVSRDEAAELSGGNVRTVSGEVIPVSRGRAQDVRAWFRRQGKPH